MKFAKIQIGSFGKKSLRALLEDGTILGVVTIPAGMNGREVSYFIDGKPVKNKGITNKKFSKNVENFSQMLKKL